MQKQVLLYEHSPYYIGTKLWNDISSDNHKVAVTAPSNACYKVTLVGGGGGGEVVVMMDIEGYYVTKCLQLALVQRSA